jgi:hypothetical protein
MNTLNICPRFSVVGAAAICLLSISPARAQLNRTWVSPSGNDSSSCTVTQPCRTFAGALPKTNPGGEIVVQDSGGFGAVTIDKSITIDAGEKYAAIEVSANGKSAVTIQAGSTDIVVLRGLTIKGYGTAQNGIFASASIGALHIENCVISDFTSSGIAPHGTAAIFIKDTTVSECGQNGINMVWSGAKAVIEHCRLENNGLAGIYLLTGPQVTVRDTVVAGNKAYGLQCDWGYLNVENCTVSNNMGGIWANAVPSPNGPSTVVVSHSIVSNNQLFGFLQLAQGGVVPVFSSRGNNTVVGNGLGDILGTITPLDAK